MQRAVFVPDDETQIDDNQFFSNSRADAALNFALPRHSHSSWWNWDLHDVQMALVVITFGVFAILCALILLAWRRYGSVIAQLRSWTETEATQAQAQAQAQSSAAQTTASASSENQSQSSASELNSRFPPRARKPVYTPDTSALARSLRQTPAPHSSGTG